MYGSNRVSLKSAPELQKLLRAAYPGYKKHDVYLRVFPEHGLGVNSYWDGGSRDTYVLVDLASGRTKSMPTSSHPYFDVARSGMTNAENSDVAVDGRGNVTLKRLVPGIALIQGGTFCGKAATCTVYVHAENMAKLVGGAV